MSESRLDRAADVVQQATTAAIFGDRDTAAGLVTAFVEGSSLDATALALALALALVDMVGYVHFNWARSIGFSPEQAGEAWSHLMLDAQSFRDAHPRTA